MIIHSIRTRKFLPPKDDLWELLANNVPKLKEKMIVAVTSKVVSIGEGRCIPVDNVQDKDNLIKQEADKYLPRKYAPRKWVMHTVKNNLLIPTAGIDASNAADHYILWPKNPTRSAKKIWKFLRQKSGVKNLGIIITDSHSIPLRRGIVGFSLSHWGFTPLKDYRGKQDIFGRTLKVSQTNIADSIATSAVFIMGEGDEQTPIATIKNAPFIKFWARCPQADKSFSSFEVPMEEDLYKVFLESVPWKKGKGGYKKT